MLLSVGTINTSVCFKDIYYYTKNLGLTDLDIQRFNYYIDKRSVAICYIDDYYSLKQILQIFESDPLYYFMLILEDKNGMSPLQIAIKNNSTRTIELFLNYLLKLNDFTISRNLYPYFSQLFKLNLLSFEKYLNTCYFVSEQMRSISKLDLPDSQDTIREFISCSILEKEFYKRYGISYKNRNMTAKNRKVKPNAIAPADKAIFENKEDAEDLHENLNIFKAEQHLLTRVSVKCIEFDWIFQGQYATQFLKDLIDSDNIHIFGQNIIRDIILFQWMYFKKAIIWKLFVPYILYFLLFCLYTTWLLERENTEDRKHGPYEITVYVVGVVIILFNFFWAYVESMQMKFHGFDYLISFWNMLDLFSIIMNIAVVIMNFAGTSFENTNRVAAISVLVLYFKLFYFLRIFFSTAYLARMIIEIMLDMKYFVTVLVIATAAFGNAFYILGRNSSAEDGNLAGENIIDAFIFTYKMGLGDFNTDGFGTRDEELLWIFFFLNTLIILIVLLNLIIAIMGDTFDRVQETQENAMLKELTNMIRENEFLLSRSRTFKKAKYLIVIEPEKAEGGGIVNWEGKLNQLKSFIEEASEKHILELKKFQDEIDDFTTAALDEKMKPIEDRADHKFFTCGQMIDQIRMNVEQQNDKLQKAEAENLELKKMMNL